MGINNNNNNQNPIFPPNKQPKIKGLKPPKNPKKYELSSSSSSYCSSNKRGFKISINKRKNPRFLLRKNNVSVTDVDAIAFPLGMSFAAVLNQVLAEDITSQNASIEHLAMICNSAVRESLTNVFGDKFDAFARNFEKSFGCTLSTLRLLKKSSIKSKEDQVRHNIIGDRNYDATQVISLNRGDSSSRNFDITNGCVESVYHTSGVNPELKRHEEVEDICSMESVSREYPLQGHVSSQIVVPNMRNYIASHSVLDTWEKSVVEQTRANDLKSVEVGLIMKKLQLKETQLALNADLNFLEKCKLSLGISRTSFKTEKFKSQLEETRHDELLKTCADFLVADLLIMCACLFYGVYAFSYDNLRQLTRSCSAIEVSRSWWIPKPMAFFNSGLQTLNCQVQVFSRMLFGALMFVAILYVLIQRSGISKQTMPITFLIMLLGIGCGFAGKLCVDTLGGDGYHWLIYWEVMCILHFCLIVFTSFFYYILNGAIHVSLVGKSRSIFPFWMRRWLFYLILILLPICCGLLPFASPKTWWEEHFSKLIRNYLMVAYDESFVDESGFDDGSDLHN